MPKLRRAQLAPRAARAARIDFEAVLAREGLAPIDRPREGRLCRACGVEPVRQVSREERREGLEQRGVAFCSYCSCGHEQVPTYTERGEDVRGNGTFEERQQSLARRIEEGAALHARAQDLLWSGELAGEALQVWEWFVIDGVSQNEMARRLGVHWTTVRDRLLGPLMARCGYPVKFKVINRKRRVNRAAAPKK